MSGKSKQLRQLKRNSSLSPIAIPRLPVLDALPHDLRQQFADIRAPQHVVEVRKECAYRFLEDIYLPAIKANREITCADLISQSRTFRNQCTAQMVGDWNTSDLITSIDAKLELLRLDKTLSPDLRRLLGRAYDHLQQLIEQCPDDLLE